MRIALDTTPLSTKHNLRGAGAYTRLLIEALKRYDKENSYYFFTRGQKIPKNVDLVHYPYFEPFFLTLPLFKSFPTVVTVHDLIPIAWANHFPRGVRGEIKWQIQRLALKSARVVITDSYASRRDIVKYAGIDKEKIKVIYLAPAEIYRRIQNQKEFLRVSQKYRLPDTFILYVGDVNWNKNLLGLLKALAILKNKKNKLVLVGKAFFAENIIEVKEINRRVQEFSLEDRVIKLGFVPEKDLVAIYSSARVYVQPSFAEGFGLPVLEAMACGCPAVVARASSLQEISGPATTVDPQNPDDIASGIKRIWESDADTYRALSQQATEWSKKFNWEKTARETIAVYEKVVAGV
ncbi:MAG: glycosyltransferase family 4 protein [Patescibacteria group bacterium]